jgi:ABC-type multidrug transport system fused ATPase/permease subunit
MKEDNEMAAEDLAVNDDESFIEERKELIQELFEKTESYIKTNVNLFKLNAINKVASAASSVMANLAVIILSVFFLVMLSIAVSIWIGIALGQMHVGFFIVAGFYGLLTILFLMFGKKMIKKTIGGAIISDLIK